MRPLALLLAALAAFGPSRAATAQSGYCRPVDGPVFEGEALLADLPVVGSRLVDLDGDGRDELAVTVKSNLQSWLTVYTGLAEGELQVQSASPDPGTGRLTSRMLFEDFDQDGLLDVVMSTRDNDGTTLLSLRIRHGLPGGGFESPETTILHWTSQRSPIDVLAAHVDGDGLLDLIVLHRGNGTPPTLRLIMNDGNGSFTHTSQDVIYLATGTRRIATADLDGDGLTDILTSNSVSNDVSILLSSPTGYLPETRILAGYGGAGLGVHDVDHDGIADIVVGEPRHPSQVLPTEVHVAKGSGATAFSVVDTFMINGELQLLEFADVEGDGNVDIVLTATPTLSTSRVEVHRGLGDGTFELRQQNICPATPIDLDVSDLDEDGLLDAVVHALELGVVTFFGRPDSELGTSVIDVPDIGPLRAAKFDGDDVPDLVMLIDPFYLTPAIGVQLGLGGGDFGPLTSFPLAPGLVWSGLHVVDAVGDGALDVLAWSRSEGTLAVLTGDGFGGLAPPLYYDLEPGLADAGASDLDGDGDADVFVVSDGVVGFTQPGVKSGVHLLRGDGFGGLEPVERLALGAGANKIASADLDADGHEELILGMNHGIGVLSARVSGGWRIPAIVASAPGAEHLLTTDLDGDGIPDLLLWDAAYGDHLIRVQLGNGFGVFTPVWSSAPDPGGDGIGGRIGVGDLNADGWPDLIYRVDDLSMNLFVRLGTGGGSFGAAVTYHCGLQPTAFALEDLNGDGLLDVAVAGFGPAPELTLLFGAGDGTLGAPVSKSLPAFATEVAIADMTLDLLPDLVAFCASTQQVVILAGVGAGNFAPPTAIALSTPPLDEIRLMDLDGDLDPDLLGLVEGDAVFAWRNTGAVLLTPLGELTSSTAEVDAWAGGDLNGDGLLDLLLRDRGSLTEVHLGTGGGSFALNGRYAIDGTDALNLVDLDLDGALDLCSIDAGEGEVLAWRGYGDGRLKAPTSSSFLGPVRDMQLADLDGDGELDAVTLVGIDRPLQVCSDLDDELSWREQCGTPALQYPHYPGADNALAVADFDRDGALDVALRGDYLLKIFFAGGSCTNPAPGVDAGLRFDRTQAIAVFAGRSFLEVADMDGDELVDLVVADERGEFAAILHGRPFGPQTYGIAAPNSHTSGAHLQWSGSRSIAANDFSLTVTDCPPGEFGLFFYGPERDSMPFGQHGYLNVGPGSTGLIRVKPSLLTDPSGSATKTFDFGAFPLNAGAGEITAGSTWNFQFWYRNPGFGFNLSDAIEVTFCP